MHLPGDSLLKSDLQSNPSSPDAVLLEACQDLETLLRSGQSARAEELLARHPSLSEDPELALDLIYVEFATRRELGETPAPEEFLARFPQWRDLLQRQFQLDELLDDGGPLLEGSDDGSTTAPAQQTASPAARFRIQGLLARGGIGQVMRALDTELHREVAVKEIQPALAQSHEVRERFLREAEITGKLEHPGIVPVYGLGHDAAGQPFYAMRLVRGQSFQEASQEFHERPGDPRRYFGLEFQKLLRRFLHVCQTVAYAHSRGVIHRDLKPENILLGPFGETLVVDWGLARVTGSDGPGDVTPSSHSTPDRPAENDSAGPAATSLAHLSGDLTRDAGEWIGTPAYMSPEQALGQAHRVGSAGDVYSLGATLYMLLAAEHRRRFQRGETLRCVIAGQYPGPRLSRDTAWKRLPDQAAAGRSLCVAQRSGG
jgi:serine/threonine protein kinase